ncbi:MAG: hypothetical protein JST86_20565 [Bacteroidetes bacterium]|nr:hypothetical protein [Bacteroidota bacterium]
MKSLETLQNEPATFSIGKAFSDGWEWVSKNMGFYILGGIVVVAIGFVAGLVPFIGGLVNSLILSPCFAASAIYITWRISKNIPWTDFGDIFKGFNYGVPVVISSVIQGLATGVVILAFFFRYLPQVEDIYHIITDPTKIYDTQALQAVVSPFRNTETLVLFLGMVAAILVLSLLWTFKYHFIVVYNLEAWPAMEMSRKITSRNILPLIGLFVLLGLLVAVSALLCGIGLLFTLPLSITAVYSAFAQITGCDEEEAQFDFEQEQQH